MNVRIRLFASVAERFGTRELSLELPDGTTAGQLLARLSRDGGELLGRCVVAVDRRAVPADHILGEGLEIAVLPPVSGGAPALYVGPDPISPERILGEVADPDRGGTVLFLGTVRGHTDGEASTHLEYEAYESMAIRVLEEISSSCGTMWPGTRIAIWHRTGTLRPGEIAVAVAAASAHRADAFAASRFAIERLKAALPVWKREWSPDGGSRWADHP